MTIFKAHRRHAIRGSPACSPRLGRDTHGYTRCSWHDLFDMPHYHQEGFEHGRCPYGRALAFGKTARSVKQARGTLVMPNGEPRGLPKLLHHEPAPRSAAGKPSPFLHLSPLLERA